VASKSGTENEPSPDYVIAHICACAARGVAVTCSYAFTGLTEREARLLERFEMKEQRRWWCQDKRRRGLLITIPPSGNPIPTRRSCWRAERGYALASSRRVFASSAGPLAEYALL
jgi:hypothetical protein